jgi:isoaspartyl peptidase/L-asparaginase-like protein (Ntn-hydrolase superfamily)
VLQAVLDLYGSVAGISEIAQPMANSISVQADGPAVMLASGDPDQTMANV